MTHVSRSARYSEREPFLPSNNFRVNESDGETSVTPLPKRQIAIILFIQLAGTTSKVVYPFISQFVLELNNEESDPKNVGYYVGLIESVFLWTQVCFVLAWSRSSDHIGRKPVLLLGLLGLCVSMTFFGLSKTFLALVVWRCLTGIINGNFCVVKSMIGDITDSTNVARGFSFISLIRCLGGIIGPFAGGALSHPHDSSPLVFGHKIWVDHPYLLSCLFSTLFAALAFLIGLVFLKETLPKPKIHAFLDTPSSNNARMLSKKPLPLSALVTRPIILSVANFCIVGYSEICFLAVQSLFYSTTIELGGLGLDHSTIFLCRSLFQIANGILQVLFFPKSISLFGPKRVLAFSQLVLIPIFGLFPAMNSVARTNGVSTCLWALLAVQLSLGVIFYMSFGAVFIYVTASAPTKRSLGSVNGIAETTVLVASTFGPVVSATLFVYSQKRNWMGGNAVYMILMCLPVIGLVLASKLPRAPWKYIEQRL